MNRIQRIGGLAAVGVLALSACGRDSQEVVPARSATVIAFVQAASAVPQTAQAAVAVRYAAAQVAGDLNVVVVGWNDTTATVTSVTDTSGNDYARAAGPTSVAGALSQSIYYAKSIAAAAAGANTVTVSFSPSARYPDIRILEYAGLDPTSPVDVVAAATGSGTTSDSGPVTTSNAIELLFGANTVTGKATGAGPGFTSRVITVPDGDIAEDRVVTAAGTYRATVPISSGTWVMQLVAFRAATAVFSLSVTPRVAVLTPRQTQQFTTSDSSVTWAVNGITGGSSSLGTISASGLYRPPAAVGTFTVQATTTAAPIQTASAKAYVTDHAGTYTHRNDNMRTGRNLNETVLTPSNVNSSQFGQLFSYALDGLPQASPLYVADVNVPGQGSRNVVYVATQHDSVYAFDADVLGRAPLWHASFIDPAAGITTVPCGDTGECGDITPEIGITGTPVIDPATGTLYVVAKTKEVSGSTTKYLQRLHALDIATGAEKLGGPVVLQASVPGSGAGTDGTGHVPFLPLRQLQRPALLLANGIVYIGFGSHGDVQPYHGWLLGYSATALGQVFALNVTPDGEGAGIWQSGAGPAADAAGEVYFATGDGTFDAASGGLDYGDSFMKIAPTGAVLDYFTPWDQSTLDVQNLDLCAGGSLLLPDQPGAHPHLMVGAGKNGTIYLVDRDNMGHFNAGGSDRQIVQSLVDFFPSPGNFSAPAVWQDLVYFGGPDLPIQALRLSGGLLTTAPVSQSASSYAFPGASFAISAKAATGGILWAVQRPSASGPGVLHAYDPVNLATELYAGALPDAAVKYSLPTVANGRVYVGTLGRLAVFGLLP